MRSIFNGKDPDNVLGVYFKKGDELIKQPYEKGFEEIEFEDIPYHLISDYKVYGQLEQDRIIFSMYSIHGCPYKCSFCSSPAQYSGFAKNVDKNRSKKIVDHIQFVHEQYGANYIYFIDDDSFVNLDHVESIIDEIKARQIPVKLGFRGARINEIKKMSDGSFQSSADAGTDIMHIGAESGSNRILKLDS